MTVPGRLDLDLYRGDTFTLGLAFKTEGAPLVLPTTGWRADIRPSPNAEVIGSFTVDATSAATGLLVIGLDATATDDMPFGVWDLEQDNGTTVRTYLRGSVRWLQDVTR